MATTRTAAKRAETKCVKHHLRSLGFTDVRIGHSSSGWLDIQTSTTKPADCFCSEVPRNVGRCSSCTVVWHDAYVQIKTGTKALTGRTGEYDGYIQVHLRLI